MSCKLSSRITIEPWSRREVYNTRDAWSLQVAPVRTSHETINCWSQIPSPGAKWMSRAGWRDPHTPHIHSFIILFVSSLNTQFILSYGNGSRVQSGPILSNLWTTECQTPCLNSFIFLKNLLGYGWLAITKLKNLNGRSTLELHNFPIAL